MKAAIVTGSRADWNGLGMVARELYNRLGVEVSVIAIGQHADNEQHLRTIIEDGFDPHVIATNWRDHMALGCGKAMLMLAPLLDVHRPDVVIVLGDRFEILAAAATAALLKIPIAHIGGGDVTEGSIDNKLRYGISALADYHFATNAASRDLLRHRAGKGGKGVIALCGNPALDRITQTPILTRTETFTQLGLGRSECNVLVAYHAATAEDDSLAGCKTMLDVLNDFEASYVVLGTNADSGSPAISKALQDFVDRDTDGMRVLRDNLAPRLFYSVLAHFDCMVGNSSAGLIETPSFGIRVVNIGPRQAGRPQPANVQSVEATFEQIKSAMSAALFGTRRVCANPYGDGRSASRIAGIIKDKIDLQAGLIVVSEPCST